MLKIGARGIKARYGVSVAIIWCDGSVSTLTWSQWLSLAISTAGPWRARRS